jgi:serine/threonine protein phosphatase 1
MVGDRHRKKIGYHVNSPHNQTRSGLGKVSPGIRIYAIGDIHGHVELLDQIFTRIDSHLVASPIQKPIQVFLGDYVDRGPASCSVIDRLIERAGNHETVFLKGNHEAFFADFLNDPSKLDEWRRFGGLETLVSYGLKPSGVMTPSKHADLAVELERVLPPSHLKFFAELKTFFECGDYFFVHAGVRPGIALNQQQEKDLLWIRGEFLDYEKSFGKIVVHGHTPVLEPEIHSNRINIDTGAYATGILTCLMLEADKIDFV